MQELNKVENLPLTGERYIPGMKGDMQLEHLHRYAVAAEYVKGKVVLDIACGEGYGSVMLSGTAQRVFGVDISPEAVNHAKNKYKNEKIEFREGSCSEIPLPDRSIDVVISFETIEHHDQHDTMMAEIKRVLKPQGILIISSPDKHNYSDVPAYKNPFHVKELYHDEFKALLEGYFRRVTIHGQRIVYGSSIFAQDRNGRMITYNLKEMCNSDLHKARSEGLVKPIYFIAIASDSALPEAVGGILEQPVWESEVYQSALAEKDRAITVLQEIISQNTKELRDANAGITQKERQVAGLENELGCRKQALSDIKDVIVEKERALENANTDIANLRAAVAENEQTLADANTAIAENESTITALEETIYQKDAVITEKSKTIDDLNDINAQKETVIAEKDQVLENANADIVNLQAAITEKESVLADKDRQIHGYREELYSVYTSKSWRYTLPMRKAGTRVRHILSIPHHPWFRAKIKRVYFLLPALVRKSRLVETLKNRFKNKEIL